jgi:hypothetical protein
MVRRPSAASVFTLIVALAVPAAHATGEVEQLLFQGVLRSTNGTLVSGAETIVFRIYDAATDGNLLWQETHSVTLVAGRISLLVGSVDPIGNPLESVLTVGADRWLAVQIGDDPEAAPRQALSHVPLAFVTRSADGADAAALTGTMFADGAVTLAKLSPDCQEGEILVRLASGWSCAVNPYSP